MTTRTRREKIVFKRPSDIQGIDRQLPAGSYEVIIDEEMIEGLSFPSFRRVATFILLPGVLPHQASIEMISVTSAALSDALLIDAGALH